MCGRYYFSVDLLDEIRELVEPGDWKLELGLLEKDMHPGDVAPVITIRDLSLIHIWLISEESSQEIRDMAMERGRIVTDGNQETSVPGIYAIGLSLIHI